ncbi:MAG: hypothetical protein AB7I38_17345 [Dehalococcoidia bacterium]
MSWRIAAAGARRYWLLAAIVLLLCALAGVIAGRSVEPRVEATVSVAVAPPQDLSGRPESYAALLPSLVREAASTSLRRSVEETLTASLRTAEWDVAVIPDRDALAMRITVSSPDRSVAERVASAYARVVSRQLRASGVGLVQVEAERPNVRSADNAGYVPIVAGLGLGMVVAMLLVVSLQVLRPRIDHEEDLKTLGLDVLWDDDGDPALATLGVERLRLTLEGTIPRAGSVAIISLEPGDGATQVAIELAASAGVPGREIVLVEGDVRRRLLVDAVELGRGTTVPVWAPPTGSRRPVEIADSEVRDLIEVARLEGATAVVHAPPLEGAPEGLVVAGLCDAVVLVVRGGRHGPDEVRRRVADLHAAGARIAGVVLRRGRPRPHAHLLDTAAVGVPQDAGASPSRTRRTARNAGYVFLQTGLPPLLNVLLLPLMVNKLGAEAYGLFATLLAVFIFSSLFDLGLSKSVVRFVAAYSASDDVRGISRFVSTTFVLYLGIGVIVLLAAVLFAFFGLGFINVPPDLEQAAFWSSIVFGLSGLYNFPAGTLGGVMGGLKRHDAESGLHVSVAVAQVVGQAAVVLAGGGVLAVVIAFQAPNLIKPWVRLHLIRRFLPGFQLRPSLFSRDVIREISTYSGWSFLVESGRRVVESLDPVIVSAAFGLATVTPYTIGLQVGRLLQRLTMPVAFVLLPVASELHALGDHRVLQRLLVKATRYTAAVAIGLGGPLFVLSDDVIRVWLGESYPLAVDVSRIFLVASALLMARAPLMQLLESTVHGVRLAGVWIGIETVVNVAVSLVLLQFLDARGVILATVIATVGVTLLGLLPAATRLLDVSAASVLQGSLVPLVRPLVIAVPVWLIVSWLVDGASLIPVLAGVAISALVFFAGFWMTLEPAERRDLRPVRSR